MKLTVSYITNRIEPKFEWFFSSLRAEGVDCGIQIIDYHADAEGRVDSVKRLAEQYGISVKRHITPKPSVWQGVHRLTQKNFFAASNASNTAIATCDTPWVVFVDDLSVLMPGWWKCVNEATLRNGVTCGAYRKVHDMSVDLETGRIKPFRDNPNGWDVRGNHVGWGKLVPCGGEWFFGCSFVASIDDLLKCNGFDEDCDGMGYQDTITGSMLSKNGVKFWYDSRMLTIESEDLHHTSGQVFLRWDPGQSPNDKSHAMINMLNSGRKWAPNYFGPEGLRGLRESVLNGGQFPIVQIPQNEWFTGIKLKDISL